MNKTRNILVPIDFSEVSYNAYCYAKKLSEYFNATLTLINIKKDVVIASDVIVAPYKIDDEFENGKVEEFIIKKEYSESPDIIVKTNLKIKTFKGDPTVVLTDLSKNSETDLIVMGTTGSTDFFSKLFGSTSIKLSNKAHCPVILVPRNAKWLPIEQIMYAGNYDSITPKSIVEITEFATKIKADIHFVNVKNYDPLFEIKQKEINLNEIMIPDNYNLYYEKHTIYGNNTVEELKTFSEEKGINLMVFVSKHRNFWEDLMHKSITENMALSTTIPMMVIHSDD